MFIRKYWLPLSVFLVAIVGVGIYYLAIQPPPDPIVIYKAVEPLEKQAEEPTTETPVVEKPPQQQQGGHTHADGTWHAETHEPVAESSPVETETPVAKNNAAPKARDMSFLDNPEEAIRRHAEILLDLDIPFWERHDAFWEHHTLAGKLIQGYYGEGEYRDKLKKLQRDLVDDPLLRMNGIDPEQLRASVPRKHDPSYVPAPPITLKFGPDSIKRAREALKEGGDTQ